LYLSEEGGGDASIGGSHTQELPATEDCY